ncbi:hypothetical protein LZC95_05770 [Pendulispora brunnea]|uniref:AB hydrolase-1 domain-containing protein n=1 Tax=Pendulispora brunnea TaxID=2905690 RepID=A0ABZ2KCM2_9BACT
MRKWLGVLVVSLGVASTVDEGHVAVAAAHMIRITGYYRDPDVAKLPEVMSAAYARAREHDVELMPRDPIEFGDVQHAAGVLIFLHGFAGSFVLPCWEISRAAARANLATVCPSTGVNGDWWSASGERTLRATVAALRRRGVKSFYLAGLSNGGVGATLLAPRMRGTFKGLILLSGASASAANPGIPVLAVQGRRDTMMPASMVRAYTRRVGGKYVELDAGHFAMLLRAEETHHAVVSWLTR